MPGSRGAPAAKPHLRRNNRLVRSDDASSKPGARPMSLRSLATTAGGRLERAVNEDVITLAVTGLSRAGKTVFITSLIQNLLALAAQKDVLPRLTQRLSDRGVNRLRDVTILPAGISALPHFDHAAKLAGLSAAEPVWPERTADLAMVSLALPLPRRSAFGQKL